MFEIAAAIISVLLATILGLVMRAHRSLVTYEIVSKAARVVFDDGKLSATDPNSSKLSHEVSFFEIRIQNRGWKNINGLRIHTEGQYDPFSVEKKSSSISSESVRVEQVGRSLEIATEFFPRKEKLIVSFARLGWPYMSELKGAGSSYKVESIHFYEGQQEAISLLKMIATFIIIGTLVGVILGNNMADVTAENAGRAAGSPSAEMSK